MATILINSKWQRLLNDEKCAALAAQPSGKQRKMKRTKAKEAMAFSFYFIFYELRVQMLRQKGRKRKELIVGIARSAG